MDESPSAGRTARCIFAAAVMLLASCSTTSVKTGVEFKSETEIAVAAIKNEWLTLCEGPQGPVPENGVGALLQDYTDIAAAFAVCKERNKSLIMYLRPIVKKEREGTSATPNAGKPQTVN